MTSFVGVSARSNGGFLHLGRRSGPVCGGADDTPRQLAGALVILKCHHSIDDNRPIADGPLNQPLSTSDNRLIDRFWCCDSELLHVIYDNVRWHSDLERPDTFEP